MHVAAWADDAAAPIGSAVRIVVAATLDTLRAAGMSIDETRPGPTLAELFDLWTGSRFKTRANGRRSHLELAREANPKRTTHLPGATQGSKSYRDRLVANEQRHRYLKLHSYFENHDAPPLPWPPYLHPRPRGQLSTRTFDDGGDDLTPTSWPVAFGGICLPAPPSLSGSPTKACQSAQVVGPYLGTNRLAVAAIEEVIGVLHRPPQLTTATPTADRLRFAHITTPNVHAMHWGRTERHIRAMCTMQRRYAHRSCGSTDALRKHRLDTTDRLVLRTPGGAFTPATMAP
jgi:hypothetical protein